MTKETFLKELEQYLQGISEEERKEALLYYENYFEDASIENEEAVLEELGSPREVASSILADLEEAKTEKADTLPMPAFGMETQTQENGQQEKEDARKEAAGKGDAGKKEYKQKNDNVMQEKIEKRDNSKWILVSLLLLFTLPVWLGVVLGMIGTLVGLVIAVVVLVIGFGLASGICVIAGIGVFAFGVFRLLFAPLEGVLCFGSGLLVFGIGILLFLAVLLCVQLIKFICKGIVYGCNALFPKKRKTTQNVYS